ncbi:MAG: ATP-binding cassette domain-containing protein [Ardenticatenaceae bacterium]
MAQEPIIICENLVKIYKVADLEILALQGLELTVQKGEMIGIVGASGSGKTTLMNVLGGLIRPSAGRVWVDGYDLLKMSNAALNRYRRTKVGFVWQQGARNLIAYLNAVENVELPMTLAGLSGGRTRQRAEELLDLVGLAERRHHYMPQLSGGEQQRVAIAVALANKPTILLADEPTGELDSATALSIYHALQTLNRELGLTTLIVSHDPTIARHVERVMAIRDGKSSSETVRAVRRPPSPEQNGSDATPQPEEEEELFEELVVLDSAGRLQIPKEYLRDLNIKGRVRLEMTEEGILIQPVPEELQTQHNQTAQIEAVAEAAKKKGQSKWFSGLRDWFGGS